MRKIVQLLLTTILICSLMGCAGKSALVKKPTGACYTVKGKTYYPMKHVPAGYRQQGVASWYGPGFHGKKTASGEIYNMNGLSAAHNTLPLNTVVKVKNLHNHQEVTVRVNDRGPFVGDRVIDLSLGAARKLGMVGPGTVPVSLVVVGDAKSLIASRPRVPIKKSHPLGIPNPFFRGKKFGGLLALLN